MPLTQTELIELPKLKEIIDNVNKKKTFTKKDIRGGRQQVRHVPDRRMRNDWPLILWLGRRARYPETKQPRNS